MTWLELSVDVEPEAVESICELLAQYGYNGGVVVDQPIIPGADGLEYQPQPGDIVLRLDPGMAFGTGLHPTTQLCIGFIEQYVKPDMPVLDLGCGSGVLAIAAARLGATVLALDTDPIAVTATRENV